MSPTKTPPFEIRGEAPPDFSIGLARRVNFRILQLTMPLPPTRGLYDPSLEQDAYG